MLMKPHLFFMQKLKMPNKKPQHKHAWDYREEGLQIIRFCMKCTKESRGITCFNEEPTPEEAADGFQTGKQQINLEHFVKLKKA